MNSSKRPRAAIEIALRIFRVILGSIVALSVFLFALNLFEDSDDLPAANVLNAIIGLGAICLSVLLEAAFYIWRPETRTRSSIVLATALTLGPAIVVLALLPVLLY